ncbi:HEAT repeat domain-containing protein [Mesoterricola sediminis]|uniref:HEAT repeat domain-containing protein n=1 Tax=Mesoterricola sediminis TaxID=2927980 RepID=A0AA48GM80_9BACT|nr:HEAT repeat domain-containing protein [Mesoterricola sediminis]BDU75671.1 hypothetical protein METESE_06290 [Mesoterricola sediminis]
MPAPQPLTRLIELLHQAYRAQLVHAPDHPDALAALAALEAYVPGLLETLGAIELRSTGVGFATPGGPVTGAPNAAMALAREMEARGMGGVAFLPGLDPEELRTLIFILQLRPQRLEEMGGASLLLPDDGLLRPLPPAPPPQPRPASPLREADVELDWNKVFTDAPRPADPDPVPWAGPGPTVGGGFRDAEAPALPEPLTPEELRRAAPPQPAVDEASLPPIEPIEVAALSPAALREEFSALFRAALATRSSPDKAGPRSPWGVDQREALVRFGFRVPDFGALEGAGARLSLDTVDAGAVRDALRRALSDFPAGEQGDLVLGFPGLPEGEFVLRRALDFLGPEMLAQAVAHVHTAHAPSMFDLALLAVALLQCVPDRELCLEAVRGRLQFEGWGMQEVEEFKEAIQWECQGTDTKLHMSLERRAIHKLDPHLVKTLGRQLIRGRRVDDIRSMLAQLEKELASPQAGVRRHGMEILAHLAEGLADAGLPQDLENRILAAARDRLTAENDPPVAQWCAQTLETILDRWIVYGLFSAVHLELSGLGDLAYPLVGAASWKPQLIRDLLARLASPRNIGRLVDLLHHPSPVNPADRVQAVLALMGLPAAAHLARALEEEGIGANRTALAAALAAFGRRALPVLLDLLSSPRVEVVLEAVDLLARAGDPSATPELTAAVAHPDGRIRRAAVAALAHLGGAEAAAQALAAALAQGDAELRLEGLDLLGGLGDAAALPAVLAILAEAGPGEEAQRLRLRAIETLGRIPAPGAARPLLDLFQKKGLFRGREPLDLRLAAARALAAQNTTEARECMALALEQENAEPVKALLRQSLVR